jgi:hypothetical protein
VTTGPLFAGFAIGPQSQQPTPEPIEVRMVVQRVWGDRPLTSAWEWHTPTEYETLRADLLTQIGDPDGAVSVWTGDNVEVIVPSRRIRALTLMTRPVPPLGGQ